MTAGTARSYELGMADYRRFAQRRGLVTHGELDFPTEPVLIGFAVWLAGRGTAPSGISSRLRGVGLWTQSFTGIDPRLSGEGKMRQGLGRVLTGIRREHSRRKPLREALTTDRLRVLVQVLRRLPDVLEGDKRMLEAALNLGVYGLCRCGEIVSAKTKERARLGATRADVSMFYSDTGEPMYFEFLINSSKRDTDARGEMTKIFATGGDFCPLLAMQRYLASSQRRGGGAQSVLFSYIDGTYLTRDRVNRLIKRLCVIAGFDPARYSTHSMRAGGATTLSLIGATPAVIKQLGRWKSEAYTAYIRVPDHQLRALQARMAGLLLPSTSRAMQATVANTAWAQLRTELINSG